MTLNLLNLLFLLGLFVTFLTIFMAIAQFSWSSDDELQPISPVIKCSIEMLYESNFGHILISSKCFGPHDQIYFMVLSTENFNAISHFS